jgi:hypothetical protein
MGRQQTIDGSYYEWLVLIGVYAAGKNTAPVVPQ